VTASAYLSDSDTNTLSEAVRRQQAAGRCNVLDKQNALQQSQFILIRNCRISYTAHPGYMHTFGTGRKLAYNRNMLIGGALLARLLADDRQYWIKDGNAHHM